MKRKNDRAFEEAVSKILPKVTPNERSLIQEIMRIGHTGESVAIRFEGLMGAWKDFLELGDIKNPYQTDVLLEELDDTCRKLAAAAHNLASARGQIDVLRMDRESAARPAQAEKEGRL